MLGPEAVRAADPANGKQSIYLGLDTTLPDITAERREEIKKKYPHFPIVYDQQALRREYVVRLPRWVEDWANRHLIRDSRDTIMLSVMANMIGCTGGLSVLLFMFPSHKLGLSIALFNAGMWVQRFILMMHYSEHYTLFRREVGFLKYFMPWVMAPFYGIPTGMYRTHHIMMHHKENNMFEKDLSSTEPYQRDSFLHWLHYWAMFWALIVTLPMWAIRKAQWVVARDVCMGCGLWVGMLVMLTRSGHGIYAFYQFGLPFIISSFALMFGNWSQHMFVHPSVATSEDLLSSLRYNCNLTLNVFNHFDNQVAFNDGYHITHHVKPACHWTEMPLEFLTNLEKYAEHDPVVFDRCGFFDIGLNFLIRKNFDPDGAWKWAADHLVSFGREKRSVEEARAFLEERLRPIPERTIEKAPK
jgi:fatty acid desaturase